MKQEMIEMQMSHVGTEILGRRYDLIHIDFEAEHPSPHLVEMVKERPDELITRTDIEAASYVADYVGSHLERCDNGCSNYKETKSREAVKFY